MTIFTPETALPSEKTLSFIRQLAYSYRVIRINGKTEVYSLN